MIDINAPSYPSNKPCLQPEKLVIDAGFSEDNFHTLLSLSPSALDLTQFKPDFSGFFELYDLLRIEQPSIRDKLNDFGYSPYNLILIINSLDLHKQDFSTMIGCSFSKILANTTHRSNSYFRPFVGNQWHDLLHCYSEMVKDSDQHHCTQHYAETLFFMRADKSLPLSIPSFSISSST